MKEMTNNSQQIAACGLYCGACKKFLNGKCPGCKENEKASWCKIHNSDRAACIRYIRENGENAFVEKMAKDQQMTMKRK